MTIHTAASSTIRNDRIGTNVDTDTAREGVKDGVNVTGVDKDIFRKRISADTWG